MTISRVSLAATLFVSTLALTSVAGAQDGQSGQAEQAEQAGQGRPATAGDCGRWPASVFDEEGGLCICPTGMWWNLRGDACLPREHAAGEVCTAVWPSSTPYFQSGGGYRCVCAPPLLWSEEDSACRKPVLAGTAECSREWPGTLPVMSPSGGQYECRCPAGLRWEEAGRSCVPGAPVVAPLPTFFEGPGGDGDAAPEAPRPAFPIPSARQGQDGQDEQDEQDEQQGQDGQHGQDEQDEQGEQGEQDRQAAPAGAPPAAASDEPRPAFPLPAAGAAVAPSSPSPKCQGLLDEIRALAEAGRPADADALGMKAAVSGCDPTAISEASRAKPPR